MEGVLVSAKRVGGTITTAVVTGKTGLYVFPHGRLKPGHMDAMCGFWFAENYAFKIALFNTKAKQFESG